MKNLNRRQFLFQSSKLVATAAAVTSVGYSEKILAAMTSSDDFDFVIVGSGAGGGPLAARLVEAGFRVLILEAGGNKKPLDYTVPAFSLLASENPEMNWNFFPRHYSKDSDHGRRFVKKELGMLYPRASTVGGCTAHHVMLMIPPQASDWENLEKTLDDPSWNPMLMRKHYEKVLEWLPIEFADPTLLKDDSNTQRVVSAAVAECLARKGLPPSRLNLTGNGGPLLQGAANPMLWDQIVRPTEGPCLIPQSIKNGERFGTRELLESIQKKYPGRLTVKTNVLVSKILFDKDEKNLAANGVEYFEMNHAYRADPLCDRQAAMTVKKSVLAKREVILSAGTYNTPQLLMLSGIGPQETLKSFNIPIRKDLQGVGKNLQDRYEISVVHKFEKAFSIVENCTFGADGDPCLEDYKKNWRKSPYGTNGALIGFKIKSEEKLEEPDTFIFGTPSRFEGYVPGFAKTGIQDPHFFTWAILKGYTKNTGEVTLRSTDPREVPQINFRYFNDGQMNADSKHDMQALLKGVDFARGIYKRAEKASFISANPSQEIFPGPELKSDSDLTEFIKKEAWGHHASCSCRMGKDDDAMAVVNTKFKVRGVKNLRIVDASVFPKIPGFFIALPIFILSEKAAATILEDHKHG